MTQEQLVEQVGTAGKVIGNLVSGDRGFSHKWLLTLAPVLETMPNFLLDHHEAQKQNRVAVEAFILAITPGAEG